MIVYSSKDIVKRSLDLADLTNSSFLSWNEKLEYLNTSWNNIYQKIIDEGEKNWLNTLYLVPGSASTDGTHYTLPDDFYQIYSVSSYPNNSPILRRAKNEPYSALRYDIINDDLIIYGSAPCSIQIQYYPVPQTLSFPADIKDLSSVDASNNYLDCDGDNYLYTSWLSGTLTIGYYNISTGASKTVATIADTMDLSYAGIISNRVIIVWNSALSWADQTFLYIIDIATGTTTQLSGVIPVKGDEIYTYNSTTGKLQFRQYYNSTWNVSDVATLSTGMAATGPMAYQDGNTAYYNGSSILYNGTAISTAAIGRLMPIRIIDSTLYWNDINNNAYAGSVMLSKGNKVAKYIGVNKADTDTGYGISYIGTDGEVHVMSTFIDTQLDFTYNIEFQLLAYDLAVAYMTKQKADITLIAAKLDKMWVQFKDMINRDINQNVRITNAYAR